ncbi:sulfatase, partial [Candidatus Altiarchaeota archaeon]
MGVYGYHRNTTPNIDKFSREAVLFENAFVPRGQTWPSLTSLLTSLYHVSTGVRGNGILMNVSRPTIGSILSAEGYKTVAFLARYCEAGDLGFDEKYCSQDPNLVKMSEHWIQKNRGERIFLWMHLFTPHLPYYPCKEYDAFSDEDYAGLYNGSAEQNKHVYDNRISLAQSDLEHIISRYDGEILETDDDHVRKVLKSLEEYGMLDSSIVVITSDHGDELFQHNNFCGHSFSIYDSVLHVPLLVRLPDGRFAGKRVG